MFKALLFIIIKEGTHFRCSSLKELWAAPHLYNGILLNNE